MAPAARDPGTGVVGRERELATGWVVGVYDNTTRTQRSYAWVICAYVAS